ncbi:MAG: MBL fold metallo-hydrolase [Gemmatimonadaceae bacterium]|nr:MBL fold metallo-hydrolase [Gemmatimonadaceae bacterium]
MLDAGSGLRALGALGRSTGDTVEVLLTHRHLDHIDGLPHFAPLYARDARVRVRCASVSASDLRASLRTVLSPPLFPVSFDQLTHTLEVVSCDGQPQLFFDGELEVTQTAAQHPGGAGIYRLSDRSGPLVAYAPDNELGERVGDASVAAWRRDLALFLRDIPVLIHDATYVDDELVQHAGWGHSSAEEATRLALACGAGTLVLHHHHPDRTDDDVARIVERCQAIVDRERSPMRLLAGVEGLTIRVEG